VTERIDKPTCPTLGEDLVAAVWDKLDAARRDEVLAHAASCPACAAELRDVRFVKSGSEAVGRVAVTADFRRRLMSRVRRATPASELASVGPASRRLASMAERDRPVARWLRPRLKVISLAVSVAAAAAFLLVSKVVEIETPTAREGVLARAPVSPAESRASVARWRQRRECAQLFDAASRDSTVDVTGILDDGQLLMTASYDVSQHERCVLLFSSAEWETLRAAFASARPGPERSRFERLALATQTVEIAGGRLTIPQQFVTEYLDGETDLVILKLDDRAEIWSRASFGTHTRSLPPIPVDMGDVDDVSSAPAAVVSVRS
jgi:DNA-binding transcriptional regulator/RsmH inhibitor MraZ